MKKASDWYLGFMHWLIGGFAIPLLLFSIVFMLSLLFIEVDPAGNIADPLVDQITRVVFGIAGLIFTWFGARMYARHLKRTYRITNANSVASIATGFFVVVGLIMFLPELIIPEISSSASDTISQVGIFLAQISIFYFVSKKELH